MTRKLLFSLFLLSLGSFSQAAVYQWTDANGHTHFGDRPPAKVSSREVRVNAAPAQTDATARDRQQKMTEFLEQRQKEREARQAAETKARQQAERQAEMCRKLQARLKYLKSVSTFYDINDDGEREYVSEEDNQQIRNRFRAKVKETCGE
ncbi:DUF4124 domain-containing protein [Marinobacter vinifirmus]|uniref:DUF4124 domain-containing protein n=1 Tax=Marinobacter vinifirmus TaxID=355591 RepID=A0A558B7G7_9GAMM|nr:DUF4124 domain-containing protein [Marinobacter vinifirmus]TVT32448.1 MAG: DUF4124 domain-containing protein [Marinobacter vinifirmus]